MCCNFLQQINIINKVCLTKLMAVLNSFAPKPPNLSIGLAAHLCLHWAASIQKQAISLPLTARKENIRHNPRQSDRSHTALLTLA